MDVLYVLVLMTCIPCIEYMVSFTIRIHWHWYWSAFLDPETISDGCWTSWRAYATS